MPSQELASMKMLNAMDSLLLPRLFSLGLFEGAFDLEKFGLKYIRVILLTSTFWHLVQPWQKKFLGSNQEMEQKATITQAMDYHTNS